MKKTIITAGTILLFATSLLFLSGCRNAMQQPPETGEPGMGLVRLSLGYDDRARTIMPGNITITGFHAFSLVFSDDATPPVEVEETFLLSELVAGNIAEVVVPAGTWSLVVTGYLNAPDLAAGNPAARYASAAPFAVSATAYSRTATLTPIITDAYGWGYGTFSWAINAPAAAAGSSIVIVGRPAVTFALAGEVDVPVGGDHRVILTLNNGTGGTAVISSSLQIFQSMTSHWAPTVDADHFIMDLTATILRSWNGTVWAFDPAITPAHFGAMSPTPILGLGGLGGPVDADDMTNIVATFNQLSTLAAAGYPGTTDPIPAPGPYTIERLRELADATRIVRFNDVGPAPDYTPGLLNTGGFTTAAAARTAIAGIAMNGTPIDDGDTGAITLGTPNANSATVVVGYYTAVRVFTGPVVAANVDFEVSIVIDGFNFTNAADGFTITPTATLSYISLREGGVADAPLPVPVTVTSTPAATSWSINGGARTPIGGGSFNITYDIVRLGRNSITLYLEIPAVSADPGPAAPARDYSVRLDLVVAP